MWGTWFAVTFGLTGGLILLIGAVALSAWSPVFAVIAFLVIAVVIAAGAAFRRSTQYVEATENDSPQMGAAHPSEADILGQKAVDRGAPAAGEGSGSGAETIPPPTRP